MFDEEAPRMEKGTPEIENNFREDSVSIRIN
jgi:hypothetical protein